MSHPSVEPSRHARRGLFTLFALPALVLLVAAPAAAVEDEEEPKLVEPAPPRPDGEGQGPFDRLILRGVMVVDGTGAPPMGPVDIVIEGNRIEEIRSLGMANTEIDESRRPKGADYEVDLSGSWVLPGLVDLHVHTGGVPKAPRAEYIYKLWMAHGITTARGVPSGPLEWDLSEKERSRRNEITAPRFVSYQRPGSGKEWRDRDIRTPADAREWVRYAHEKGVDGLKLGALPPKIMAALLDEAGSLGMGSTAHLDQMGVGNMNAIDSARLGLVGMTHFYGLFESMYEGHDVQPWPAEMNYMDEQFRFGQVARQWRLVEPGGERWNALLEEFLELDFFINPTMTIYSAGRDVFLNEYKNRGGRVTVGSDSGFIYQTYGFGTILELEMLQEAGFHPLEVVRSATMHGAEELVKASGEDIEFGIVREGMLADLLVVDENPLANLKVLYGTGAVRLNDATGRPERVGGVRYTIKDGIVFDAKRLLADVADMVAAERKKPGARPQATAGGALP
ncbi:MAG: amidohydrolase family protein [Acidobacteriota bacterium]|nr:amidohydrolase family protein [Acidobacteriota bacterium]